MAYKMVVRLCGLCSCTTMLHAICPLEGRFATLERGGDAGRSRGVSTGTLERGGDRPAGSRGAWMGRSVSVGRVLGFFESFPFFRMGRRPGAFVGSVA